MPASFLLLLAFDHQVAEPLQQQMSRSRYSHESTHRICKSKEGGKLSNDSFRSIFSMQNGQSTSNQAERLLSKGARTPLVILARWF